MYRGREGVVNMDDDSGCCYFSLLFVTNLLRRADNQDVYRYVCAVCAPLCPYLLRLNHHFLSHTRWPAALRRVPRGLSSSTEYCLAIKPLGIKLYPPSGGHPEAILGAST